MVERYTQPASVTPEFLETPHSVEEVTALFPRKWVLMRVTEVDEIHVPSMGFVVAISSSRTEISEALQQEPAPTPELRSPYVIFHAVPSIRSGPEVELAVEKLITQFNGAKAEGLLDAGRN